MGKQEIVDKIISDAEEEARAVIAAAEESAAKIIQEAEAKADAMLNEAKLSAQAKAKSLKEGMAASARLDGAKIMLAAKRSVIDSVYSKAAQKLASMGKKDSLNLIEQLLNMYAEEGDEILFAEKFAYVQDVFALKVVKEKKLKIKFDKTDIDGGFILCGKNSDKDLSFAALLAADRAENEAALARELFI